ncbi:chemotaxis response regulator protein-glutamate methylesterase [Desertifilum sp. FACHB-1129]|uniref:Protein-glutamate methylesterase/protein-glutamine glutaminase n=1 Tax=Desertifilum tharense IPPAS B-1220 TaxID=1781255 RepID=A0A1E5QHQ4_9CYAN|nr:MULTISPECIES: chemotaxis response regulator protein-glutamate methylesterase [Desertifilum]MDA0211375.1 chemotaxis response regulator protein-glutamate methylesterase [Cyanobacteria bacterium FC1]MBD2314010.1 chemotaxis response regulator protein-glutamate methylesterase [Desertifilum sp. FACHB-1129]MBD2320336.1 chemotaxis response regulator protein-glutamate methylesterase [Desertifilum sp. FACHB-866]MBD2330464.1 chemotaxis response regulator protein-glutamate methylesterase [Desertifilum s
MLRIAIVNDTLIATEALRRVIKSVPDYEIAWTATNGVQAVAQCLQDTPDLVLMDLYMPEMDGVEATRQIMRHSPCAILIVTATVEGHTSMVFNAMGYGALDVVSTPILGFDGYTQGSQDLLSKIATMGKLIGKSTNGLSSAMGSVRSSPISRQCPYLIGIGASTGGPQALATILSQLDPDFAAAIAIVQHVDVRFAPGLVEWLDRQTPLPVELAIAGSQPQVGKVLVAASNDHLIVTPQLQFAYTKEPRDYAYRPSVDVFFKSLAQNWPGKGVGVLLTGMGKDGGQGLNLLKLAGWHTIAQNRQTCVVYGMPKTAIELGAACDILPIADIAGAIAKRLQLHTKR